jgi:hypothetical protein
MPLHGPPGRPLLKTVDQLTDDQLEQTWPVYHTCFAPLETQAAQRHLMTPAEFKEQMADPAITKGLVYDDNGGLTAAGTYATDLPAVSLISWKFFRHHWPDQFDDNAIVYVPWIASSGTTFRGYHTFVEHIFNLAAPKRGLVAMDVCKTNVDVHHFIRSMAAATRRLSGGRSNYALIDTQGFYLFDPTGTVIDPLTGDPLLGTVTA